MKSIRSRIALWLLVGMGVLWLAGGTVVYLASHSAMLAEIDSENQSLSRQVRFMSRGGGGGGGGGFGNGPGWRNNQERMTAGDLIPDGIYYQVWMPDGEVVMRSENLEGRDLPRLEVKGEASSFQTVEISPELSVRLSVSAFATGRMGGGGGGHARAGGGGQGMRDPVIVAVARDLSGFEEQSQRLLVALLVIALVAGAATCVLLNLALKAGLKPLEKLGEMVAGVDSSSLDLRFGGDQMPRELQAIVARLDALMERLEQGFLRERRFSADIAHELRTPISEIQVLADLAIEWPDECNEVQMQKIREVGVRMQGVVETMLELARVEDGERGAAREMIDLEAMIAEVWRPYQELAKERGLSIELDLADGAPIRGQAELWRHVLGNLLANAAEYASEGGRIKVRRLAGGISVMNSVTGFQEMQLEKLFERFWRADESRTSGMHCGLGLSLSKACAEAMGYGVSARLEHDRGEILVIEVIDRQSDCSEPPHQK